MIGDEVMKKQDQPLCTRCKGYPVMQRRKAAKGGHFWGCPNYPRCTFTRRPHERRSSMAPMKAPPPNATPVAPVPKQASQKPPGLAGAAPAASDLPMPAQSPARQPQSTMQTGAAAQPKRATVQSPARVGTTVPPARLIGFNLPTPVQEGTLRVPCRYSCGQSFATVKSEIGHVGHCMMNANCRHYIAHPEMLPQEVKDRMEEVRAAQRNPRSAERGDWYRPIFAECILSTPACPRGVPSRKQSDGIQNHAILISV